jgi:hypothetical protein
MRGVHSVVTKSIVRAMILCAAVSVLVFLSSCTRSQPAPGPTTVNGARLTLALTPGSDYRSSIRLLVFRMPRYPQVACWLQTEDGRFVSTVYVTAKGAKKSWFSAPAAGRPEALPVWTHLQNGAPAPVDAVSGATSSGGIRHDSPAGDLKPGRYVAMLEINRPYDYNERYPRATSGVNGQPSLIYRCELLVGQGAVTSQFMPFGTGSIDGSDGSITPGVAGLTTALTLLERAEITYQPG